jgi:hypothetical protein
VPGAARWPCLPHRREAGGEETPEPLGKDFRILFDEMNYGVPVNEAMTAWPIGCRCRT